MTHTAAVSDQTDFRAREDSGNEATPTWIAAANTNWSQLVDTDFRVRFVIAETAGATTPEAITADLFYSLNGGSYAAVTASTPVQFSTFTGSSDGDATTQQVGAGSFVAGELDSDDSVTTVNLSGQESEFEYCLTMDSGQVSDTNTIALRVYNSGAALDNYAQTPTVTATTPDNLTLDDAESATEADTVTLGQTHVLTLDDAQSVTEASTVTLGGEHSLTLDDTEGNTEAGSITVTEISSFDLFLDDTEITTETSAVTVGVIRNLTLDDSESATEAASVTLGQEHTLTLDDAESGSEVSTVNFSESNQVEFNDVETSTEVTAITIGTIHNFQLVSAESGTETGSTALGQEHVLNVDNAESSTEAGSIALSENVDILVPDGDTTVGNWTDEGGASIDLYQSIDETPANDSDYIQSENSPVNSATKISLSNPSGSVNPSGPHLLSYRYQKRPSDADQQIDLVVRLIEGASTEIASWTHTNISTTVVQADQTLTAPQVGAIGNYADLHLEFEGDAP
jgi:hypothetical protein